MEENNKLVIDFFKSFKCNVLLEKEKIIIKGIPSNIQKIFSLGSELEFKEASQELIKKIKDYLKTSSSKTLLKIDFDFPKDIKQFIKLRNCDITQIIKKQENNYFSRFSFLTNFRYLNKVEQIITEIFVHEGKVVKGNLNDYNVREGDIKEASTEHLSKDYEVAKLDLKDKISEKINSISLNLKKDLSKEIIRIEQHYDFMLKEFEKKALNEKNKISLEDEMKKITDEKMIVINNEKMKHSLDIENKLINTTIIYYPIFNISVCLNQGSYKKNIELKFNPLTQEISSLNCDSCGTVLDEISLCHGGHTCCASCLHSCSECGKKYCKDCFKGVCDSCGKLVCKNCAVICGSCKKLHCKNCMRKISRSSLERCKNCIVYCSICSEAVEKNQLVRSKTGQLMCKFCLLKNR